MRMKKSDLKRLLKPIIRECLQDIMDEQLDPSAMHEALGGAPVSSRHRAPQAAQSLGDQLINPMDDNQMRMRQEIASQRGLLAQQMRRQSAAFNQDPMGQPMPPLDQLAGLVDDSPETSARRYYVAEGTGYTNPSDRVRMNSMALAQQPYGAYGGRYDPRLDAPMGGHHHQGQPHMQLQRPLMLDPGLDTPLGGGDIRPEHPQEHL